MALIQCPSCGSMEDIQAAVCSECGAPIAALKTCGECGCPLDSDSTFCPECGCPVQSDSNTADNTSGKPVLKPQNIYLTPPHASAKRKRFMVYNIIGLLQMIYPTILFWGKLIVIEIDGTVIGNFSFGEFSGIVTKFKETVGLLGLFISSDDLEAVYRHLGYIAEIKFVCYIILLWAAYNFIFGWFKINEGKLLKHCFSISWLYVAVVLIMLVLIQKYFVNPINGLISPLGEEITCKITPDFSIAVIITLISSLFYGILVLFEGNSVNSRLKTKK